MNWLAWLVGGFGATVVLTSLMEGARWLRFTRMSIPYLLGSMFTPDRDKAAVVGFWVHLLNGWLFSLIYVAAFHVRGGADYGFGALIGLAHAALVLAVLMPGMPGLHPRMASERRGPTVRRSLEPPGFLGLHYGLRTPAVLLLAHLVFGAILGGLYRFPIRLQGFQEPQQREAPVPVKRRDARPGVSRLAAMPEYGLFQVTGAAVVREAGLAPKNL